jgi:hypothetical protein
MFIYEKRTRVPFTALTKETKERSSGQTPFTLKPKQLALKKTIFNPPKILPKLKKKIHFCIKQLFSTDPAM